MERVCDIDINFYYHINRVKNINERNNVRETGANGLNKFSLFDKEETDELQKNINSIFNLNYRWSFNYCHTPDPVGLHNDYIENVKYGVIIPLDWNIEQPYTITFDRETDNGKILYKNGSAYYKETGKLIEKLSDSIDPKVAEYIPESRWHMYKGLNIHNVFEWKIGKVFLFETHRWHTSSWFYGYKSFINGFGECIN